MRILSTLLTLVLCAGVSYAQNTKQGLSLSATPLSLLTNGLRANIELPLKDSAASLVVENTFYFGQPFFREWENASFPDEMLGGRIGLNLRFYGNKQGQNRQFYHGPLLSVTYLNINSTVFRFESEIQNGLPVLVRRAREGSYEINKFQLAYLMGRRIQFNPRLFAELSVGLGWQGASTELSQGLERSYSEEMLNYAYSGVYILVNANIGLHFPPRSRKP